MLALDFSKNILFYTVSNFSFSCGGLLVQYEICSFLEKLGFNVRIRAPNNIKNSVFNNYYNDDLNLENTIVVYGETIQGNPINAKYVVRWILAPLGCCSPNDIYKSWGKNDLVYYYNSETKMKENCPIFKTLHLPYINTHIKQSNFGKRFGICYTVRKAYNTHKKIRFVHPKGSFEITRYHNQADYIKFFNNFEFFLSYDPLTFLSHIAALCGCISIVYKINNLNKSEWLKTTSYNDYLTSKGLNNLYGIAYGYDDIEYAKSTMHLVEEQLNDIINYSKENKIMSFINDLTNFEIMENTVENNYITPPK
jgi:hypothetical protein